MSKVKYLIYVLLPGIKLTITSCNASAVLKYYRSKAQGLVFPKKNIFFCAFKKYSGLRITMPVL
jgi:hypothetical protein